MKVGIVGYREYKNYAEFHSHITRIRGEMETEWEEVVSGGAKGTDTMAVTYAERNNLKYTIYKQRIDLYGSPEAYYKRNKDIVERSDVLIAFIHPKCKGTWNTVKWAKQKGIEIIIVRI